MAETDTTVPETTQEPLAPASQPSAPTRDNTTQTTDADALKSQLQKLEMERNMLRKQKDALEQEKADRERKELEEKEDYRTLAERAQAEAEALRKEREEETAKAEVGKAENEVYAKFPQHVQELAKTLGLQLTDASDEAKTSLTSKLDALSKTGPSTPSQIPRPNNPAPTTTVEPERQKLVERMKWDLREPREAAIRSAIGGLETIKALKQASGREPQTL